MAGLIKPSSRSYCIMGLLQQPGRRAAVPSTPSRGGAARLIDLQLWPSQQQQEPQRKRKTLLLFSSPSSSCVSCSIIISFLTRRHLNWNKSIISSWNNIQWEFSPCCRGALSMPVALDMRGRATYNHRTESIITKERRRSRGNHLARRRVTLTQRRKKKGPPQTFLLFFCFVIRVDEFNRRRFYTLHFLLLTES